MKGKRMEYEVFADERRAKTTLERSSGWKLAESIDGYAILLPASGKKDAKNFSIPDFVDEAARQDLKRFADKTEFKPEAGEILTFDKGVALRVVVGVLPERPEAFFFLELARKVLEPLHESRSRKIAIDLRGVQEGRAALAEAFAAANLTLVFKEKKYTDDKVEPDKIAELIFVGEGIDEKRVRSSVESAAGTNLVRYLSGLAGNDLTPSRYVKLATEMAKNAKLKTEFYGLDKLTKLKAGAFLSVTRASKDRGAGILKISYRAPKSSRSVALVGKGITFDTGGTQLKSGEHMFGMNGDMGGSAVVLALVVLAAKQKWPWDVDAYLAIAENLIGPDAYRPNDIVKTMSGKTIEVVDSDAEGRMVLSDTLWLAGQEEPDVILDFATLTGACLRAIGTSYSGAYTNRPEWYEAVIESGKSSGERVWPFPGDKDFGRCLKSDIADIKQCRLTGGSDHIEAGYFLSQFVPKKASWLHVDLSAAESDDGLAHVPSKLTGFGVRFAIDFLNRVMK